MKFNFETNIQRGILYLIKSKESFYIQVLPLIKDEYFEFIPHKFIFKNIHDFFIKYKKLPVDDFLIQEIKDKIKKNDRNDYLDELELINSISNISFENEEYYLDLIEKFAKEQSLKNAIIKSIDLIQKGKSNEVADLILSANKVCRNINLGQTYYETINDRFSRQINELKSERFKLVFPRLDEELDGGLSRKELAMVVANSGGGKSLYLVNQAVKALKENRNVLYISLEMSEDKIAQRFDSVISQIQQSKLKISKADLDLRLQMFKEKFKGNLIIKEFPSRQASLSTIRSYITQLYNFKEFKPDLLIVDYLELLNPMTQNTAEYISQQKIVEDLRGLATELNLLVWTATQPNRQGTQVTLITESELADSFGKIRPADYAISLNQTTKEKDEGILNVFVIKSR